jgi:hypothetical protein
MEVGGIENGCFLNPQARIELRLNSLIPKKFQLLFGFVWLCLVQVVFHPMWHKYGTKY